MRSQRNLVRLFAPTASYLHEPEPTLPDLQAGHEASIGRLVLRLQQSTRGLATAAEATAEEAPETSGWLADLGSRRRDDLRRLLDLTVSDDRLTRSRSDIAGTVHRWFLRLVAPAGPAGVLDEVDRGETSLRRAAQKASESRAWDSTLGRTLADLSLRLDDDLEEIRRRRRGLDRIDPRGFVAGVGNPNPQPDSGRSEERGIR